MEEPTRTDAAAGGLRRLIASCRHMTDRDRRNSRRAGWWLFAWMASYVLVTLVLVRGLLPAGLPSYSAVAGSVALGVAAMVAYVRFLREADELLRKIQLEAVALGFAGGFVAYFGIELLMRAGVPGLEIDDLFTVMFVCYLAGLFLGTRRYA